jgi:hypothetical protein
MIEDIKIFWGYYLYCIRRIDGDGFIGDDSDVAKWLA